MDLSPVLQAFGINTDTSEVRPFGTGLINHSWQVQANGQTFLLQRVNDFVFKHPSLIAENMRNMACYLAQTHPEYLFIAPLPDQDGNDLIHLRGAGYFRMFPFVTGSHSIDVVQTPEQAFEAAIQFGRFTRNLSGFNARGLHVTIPHFHHLGMRYQQFMAAVSEGNKQRLQAAAPLVSELMGMQQLVARYERMCRNAAFKLRATHHDTKISNVLFDDRQKGICVIDLDTVMPGYFISDVGDMMRTYVCPVSEEEGDLEKVVVRKEFCKAIIDGYLQEMHYELSSQEKEAFGYAGLVMTYMQALRFLTDFLLDDVYYGERYEGHNLVRARNQAVLLQRMREAEEA